MKKGIKETIRIEKETVSDDEYTITEVYRESGSEVEKGELLFSFETSKADVDVEAGSSGFLYHKLEPNLTVKVGDIAAYITVESISDPSDLFEEEISSGTESHKENEWEGVRVSESAMKLIRENGLTRKDFPNAKILREKEVLKAVEGRRADSKSPVVQHDANYNNVIIIGGRGGAKMVIEAIRSTGYVGIEGIIDDQLKKGDHVMGVPVLGGDDELETLRKKGFRNVVLSFSALHDLPSREKKYRELKTKGYQFPNVVHARATVEPSVSLGEGNIILANAMVGSEVALGNINYVNTGSMICHESVANSNNHFAPNSVIAGRVRIGSNNLVGMCVTTYFEIEMGDNNIINNGCNVVKNVKNNQIIKND